MKLEHWEPDIGTLANRIALGEIDLQPDFQRGLVWNLSKKMRLIDTILRGWSVPPIHLLISEDETLVVLDGQQRLSAIRDFLEGRFSVGSFEPHDLDVDELRGLKFDHFPDRAKRRFLNYTVSCYRLWDYSADEPYELFFRLNLPTGLTQAEKRNALFGEPRKQVRSLVERSDWSPDRIGFVNSRMSYDDVVARCLCYVEERSLRLPLPVAALEARYREDQGFSPDTVEIVGQSILRLNRSTNDDFNHPKLNKATLLTWIMVFARQVIDPAYASMDMGSLLGPIENARASTRRSRNSDFLPEFREVSGLLDAYTDRASLRVNDVLSVVLRDYAIWSMGVSLLPPEQTTTVDDELLASRNRFLSYSEIMYAVQEGRLSWGGL